MSKLRLVAGGILVAAALAAAGTAAAGHRSQATQQAAADFGAGSVSRSHARSCDAGDGAYRETTATYSGTASSGDARLNGPVTIRVHSVLNATTGLGWLEGTFRVDGSAGRTQATIRAALAGGNANGVVTGRATHGGGRLVATFSSAFTPEGGFSGGKLGAGSGGGAGVLFTRGSCVQAKRLPATAVYRLRLSPRQVVPPVGGLRASGRASLTLDLGRDASGAVTGATAVFYVNYRFPGPVTITGLALYQGGRGATGPAVLDAGTGSIADGDGRGNVTKIVTGVPAALAQALLSDPRGYYVQLTTTDDPGGALRAQLGRFTRR